MGGMGTGGGEGYTSSRTALHSDILSPNTAVVQLQPVAALCRHALTMLSSTASVSYFAWSSSHQ